MTNEQAEFLRANEGYEPVGLGGHFLAQGALTVDGIFHLGKITALPEGSFIIGIRTPQQAADPRKYLNETGFAASANRAGEIKVL
jgi:hypothetical protein